jgi:hypothetical protein
MPSRAGPRQNPRRSFTAIYLFDLEEAGRQHLGWFTLLDVNSGPVCLSRCSCPREETSLLRSERDLAIAGCVSLSHCRRERKK